MESVELIHPLRGLLRLDHFPEGVHKYPGLRWVLNVQEPWKPRSQEHHYSATGMRPYVSNHGSGFWVNQHSPTQHKNLCEGCCCLLVFLAASSLAAGSAGSGGERSAKGILDDYLQIPCSDTTRYPPGREARWDALRPLIERPEEAVPAIAAALPDLDHRVHRRELMEVLGRIKTPASSEVLIPLLQHPDQIIIQIMATRSHRAEV